MKRNADLRVSSIIQLKEILRSGGVRVGPLVFRGMNLKSAFWITLFLACANMSHAAGEPISFDRCKPNADLDAPPAKGSLTISFFSGSPGNFTFLPTIKGVGVDTQRWIPEVNRKLFGIPEGNDLSISEQSLIAEEVLPRGSDIAALEKMKAEIEQRNHSDSQTKLPPLNRLRTGKEAFLSLLSRSEFQGRQLNFSGHGALCKCDNSGKSCRLIERQETIVSPHWCMVIPEVPKDKDSPAPGLEGMGASLVSEQEIVETALPTGLILDGCHSGRAQAYIQARTGMDTAAGHHPGLFVFASSLWDEVAKDDGKYGGVLWEELSTMVNLPTPQACALDLEGTGELNSRDVGFYLLSRFLDRKTAEAKNQMILKRGLDFSSAKNGSGTIKPREGAESRQLMQYGGANRCLAQMPTSCTRQTPPQGQACGATDLRISNLRKNLEIWMASPPVDSTPSQKANPSGSAGPCSDPKKGLDFSNGSLPPCDGKRAAVNFSDVFKSNLSPQLEKELSEARRKNITLFLDGWFSELLNARRACGEKEQVAECRQSSSWEHLRKIEDYFKQITLCTMNDGPTLTQTKCSLLTPSEPELSGEMDGAGTKKLGSCEASSNLTEARKESSPNTPEEPGGNAQTGN